MRRPGGVIAVAIVAILGSLAVLGMAGLMMLSARFMRSNPSLVFPSGGAQPFDVVKTLIVESVGFAAFGVFGFIAAIALLRLKKWARVAFLVFAGWLLGAAVAGIAVLTFMVFTPGAFPGLPPDMPDGMMIFVSIMMIGFEALLAALALWWLVYLTRHPVRVVFLGEAAASLPPRGPVSVTVIGWIMLVGALSLLGVALLPYPFMMFGILFEGWAARVVIVLFGVACGLAGIGLLRWRAAAYPLALGILVAGALNGLAVFLVPGAWNRFLEALRTAMPTMPGSAEAFSGPLMTFSVALGMTFVAVQLFLLLANRRAYLDACDR